MKKPYVSQTLEAEHYQLDMSIASNCATVVSNGPAIDGHPLCADFPVIPDPDFDFMMNAHNVNFYNDTPVCDCYYSAGGEGYWTS